MSTAIKARFDDYDRANPAIWKLFKRYAFSVWAAGLRRTAAKMIIERIRWEQSVVTAGAEPYKINNDFTAYYARKYQTEFPKRADLFQTRVLR
jgi:hypothetical protein